MMKAIRGICDECSSYSYTIPFDLIERLLIINKPYTCPHCNKTVDLSQGRVFDIESYEYKEDISKQLKPDDYIFYFTCNRCTHFYIINEAEVDKIISLNEYHTNCPTCNEKNPLSSGKRTLYTNIMTGKIQAMERKKIKIVNKNGRKNK